MPGVGNWKSFPYLCDKNEMCIVAGYDMVFMHHRDVKLYMFMWPEMVLLPCENSKC